jgi:hypothetical protein
MARSGASSRMEGRVPFPRIGGERRSGQHGTRFGLEMGQFGPWAQKQSCSPHNALQLLLRILAIR